MFAPTAPVPVPFLWRLTQSHFWIMLCVYLLKNLRSPRAVRCVHLLLQERLGLRLQNDPRAGTDRLQAETVCV